MHNVTVASPKQQFLGDQNGHCNFVGEPDSLNIFWPIRMTGQLTIFYDGHVNVYDDVSSDKVQKIISLASKGPNTTPNVMNQTAHTPIPTILVAPIDMAGSTNSRTETGEHNPCANASELGCFAISKPATGLQNFICCIWFRICRNYHAKSCSSSSEGITCSIHRKPQGG